MKSDFYFKLFHEQANDSDIYKSITDAKKFQKVELISCLDSVKTLFLGQTLSILTDTLELEIEITAYQKIGKNGAIGLSDGIQHLKQLQSLSLDFKQGNIVDQIGVQALGSAINNLAVLNKLVLRFHSGNSIEENCAHVLANTFQKLLVLKQLELRISWNFIGKLGAISIGQSLRSMNQLEYLNIQIIDFSVDQEGVHELLKNISFLVNLKNLYFEIGYTFDQNIQNNNNLDLYQYFKDLRKLEKLTFILQVRNQDSQNKNFQFGKGLNCLTSLKNLFLNLQLNSNISNEDVKQLKRLGQNSLQNLVYFQIKLHNNEVLEQEQIKRRSYHKMIRLIQYKISNDM